MEISICFGESRESLAGGFGFTREGLWRGGVLPGEAAGLLIDDRNPPSVRGAEAAGRALRDWSGWIVLDLERPPGPGAERLAQALAGKRTAVPPALAGLPHGAVLAGPWTGAGSFARWLGAQQDRYGPLVLDALPLRVRGRPGEGWAPWTGPLPETGYPCPGAGCLQGRLADGSVLLWDTRETLAERCRAAGVAAVVFGADWEGLGGRS